MDMRDRILFKIWSSSPYQWVVRKIGNAMLRRAAKAPEVQERIKALRATAPNAQQRFQARTEYLMALGNELLRSKFVKYGKSPEVRAVLEAVRVGHPDALSLEALLEDVENGTATAWEIEEFRRIAEDVMRRPQYPPEYKERVESALSLLERP